jgi:hypothetical protein
MASNARLDGSVPQPPAGVLDEARTSGRNIVTWQPAPGVRVAAVVIPWSHGTVLVGRSLKDVEDRQSTLIQIVGFGWLAGLIALAVVSLAGAYLTTREHGPASARG